jgi:alpha-galactosidase
MLFGTACWFVFQISSSTIAPAAAGAWTLTSRSAPLWRTDYDYGEPNGYQCHTFGLHFYLPIHGTGDYKTDNYTFRSSLGATMGMSWEITGKASEPIPAFQKRIRDFKDLRPYFLGDYYPLTKSENNTTDTVWLAYQLNRPRQKDGIVVAFRRPENIQDSIPVKLSGLAATDNYELFYEDSNLHTRRSGRELMDGIELTIPQKPGSLLIRYHIADQ